MSCPGAPAVDDGPAYSLSQTIASFAIQPGGARVTELDDPDHTGQFGYFTSRTLIFPQDVFGP